MPTFRTRRPNSIAASVRTLLGSSPELTAGDRIQIERGAAEISHREALAEKVRQEVELAREQERARNDPDAGADYASYASGVPTQVGRQFRRYREGVTEPPIVTVDDEGNPMPPATYGRPDISASQEAALSAHLAAVLGTRLATGKTNAPQMTQAGGNLVLEAVRRAAAAEPSAAVQNQMVAPWRAAAREPYSSTNAQGVVTNQETGQAGVGAPAIYDAAVAASRALAAERGAHAGLHGERARDVRETRPGRMGLTTAQTDLARARETTTRTPVARPAPGRTAAQEARDRAYAARQEEEVKRLERERGGREQAAAKSQFNRDPKMKGMKLGRWVRGQGFEVLGEGGAVVGYYAAD